MKFTVQPTPDFKPKEEADCSVLLKLKKGDEYNFQSEIPLQRQGGLIKIVLVCVPRVLEILEILGHTGAIIQ